MQTVFITGCANGIGRHLSEVFYQKGYQVIATDIDLVKLQTETAHWNASRSLLLALNVTDSTAWQKAMEASLQRFETIDIVINNAGVIVPGFITDLSLKDIDFQIDVNAKGVMYGSKLAADLMLKQGFGHLINIASLAGVAPIYGLPIYSASKFAVRAFTMAIAMELKPKNIHVSVICPDLVATNMLTLQLDYPAAALTFSGEKHLQVADIEKAIFERALQKKELEILVPKSRGLTAKLANFFPSLSEKLLEVLVKKGEKRRLSLKQ